MGRVQGRDEYGSDVIEWVGFRLEMSKVQVGKMSTLTEAPLLSPTESYSYRCNYFHFRSNYTHFRSNYSHFRSNFTHFRSNSTYLKSFCF